MGPGQGIWFPISEMLTHRHWSILLTPTKGGVFQDMWHTSIIRRVGFKPDGEDIILVIPRDMEIFCSSLVMLQVESCKLQLWDMLRAFQCKPMNIFAWRGILLEVCHRSETSSDQGPMDTTAELPSCRSNTRLQDSSQRHSQHSHLRLWCMSRDNLIYGSSALLVSTSSWQWTVPEAFMLTLRHISVLEIGYYLYARSINERLLKEYKIVQI